MPAVRIQEAAALRLDEIYRYTRKQWGKKKAADYLDELFAAFDAIATHQVISRPIPAELGVTGFFFRHAKHVVYWRRLSNGDIGIVTVLHEKCTPLSALKKILGIIRVCSRLQRL